MYNCLWPRAIIDWNSIPSISNYLSIDSSTKFKATISDILSFGILFNFTGKAFPIYFCIQTPVFLYLIPGGTLDTKE